MQTERSERVLLTGATGFVGGYLYPALAAAGWQVRCASRDPERARRHHPYREWVGCDLGRVDSVERALEGCNAAYYLVHELGMDDYPGREHRHASDFAEAAARAGLRRVVYLGGVAPAGAPSRHLESRLHVGEILRAGRVSTVELRSAMIIGAGSQSWRIVRDLAARLPAMVLPRWLDRHSWPVAVEDIVTGLVRALDVPRERDGWWDAPGPERLTHRELLARAREVLGHRRPLAIGVPILSPRLSSYWIGLVCDVDWRIARELVEGLRTDLDPSGLSIWPEIHHSPTPLDEAMRNAIADGAARQVPTSRAVERVLQLVTSH